MVEEPGGSWGLPEIPQGIEGLDRFTLEGYTWVASLKVFAKIKIYPAEKDGNFMTEDEVKVKY